MGSGKPAGKPRGRRRLSGKQAASIGRGSGFVPTRELGYLAGAYFDLDSETQSEQSARFEMRRCPALV